MTSAALGQPAPTDAKILHDASAGCNSSWPLRPRRRTISGTNERASTRAGWEVKTLESLPTIYQVRAGEAVPTRSSKTGGGAAAGAIIGALAGGGTGAAVGAAAGGGRGIGSNAVQPAARSNCIGRRRCGSAPQLPLQTTVYKKNGVRIQLPASSGPALLPRSASEAQTQ